MVKPIPFGITLLRMSLLRKTLKSLFWNSSGTFVYSVLQVCFLAVLARLLAPSDFGLVGAALVVVGFSTIFSQIGVGPAIIQRQELEDRHICVAFTSSLLLGIIIAVLTYVFAPIIGRLFRMRELVPILQSIAIIFPVKGFAVVSESLLQRELRFRALAVINIVSYFIGYGFVGILLVIKGLGYWALVWANLGQAVLSSILLYSVKRHKIGISFDSLTLKELMNFGVGFTLVRIANYTATQGDNLIVSRYLGANALGIYGRAYQSIMMPVNLFGQVLDTVFFPVMAIVQNERDKLALFLRRSSGALALFLFPLTTLIFILAPELVWIVLGSRWRAAIIPVQILSLGIYFRTSFKISASLARATSTLYKCALRQGIYALLVILGALIGARWGVNGVSFFVFMAIILNYLIMTQLGLAIAGSSPRDLIKEHIPGFFLSLIVAVIAYPPVFVLRKLSVSAPGILVSALIITAMILILLLRFRGNALVGENGRWLFTNISNIFPSKIKDWVIPTVN